MQHAKTKRPAGIYSVWMCLLFATAFFIDVPQSPVSVRVPAKVPAPEIVVTKPALPDFAAISDIEEKKRTFFDFLQPYVDAKNAEIRRQRQHLLSLNKKLASGHKPRPDEKAFLLQLSHQYEVPADDLQAPAFLQLLLRRVDVIPPSLVLAQAANESAWGTSRFAKEGYNFFGQWCYTKGCGLVPGNRRPSARHEVKSFNNIEEAVHAYFMNLNTFPSYQYLRLIRQDLRRNEKPIDGISLTEGLQSYSERGEDYISELQAMIHYNDLLPRDLAIIQ